MTEVKDLGPLDWRISITDKSGRPSPEFQRRWNTQRNNNALIGTITFGSGAPTGVPKDGAEYADTVPDPFVLYIGQNGTWHRVTPIGANPTALAKDTAVNGTSTDYMRADASPAIQKASASQFGIVKVDGTTITSTSGLISSVPPGVVLGFVINIGTSGTNVGPELITARSGSFTKCHIVTKTSDVSTALTINIKKNGTTIFGTNPTVAAGTSGGTVSTFTGFTSTFSAADVFTIDITSGTSSWAATVQLEP